MTVRIAGEHDLSALARLRRDWAAERVGAVADENFDRTFAAWWRAELPRRTFWVAEAGSERTGFAMVGSLNVVEVASMPRPGARSGRWGYVGNAFVIAACPEREVASALLNAAVGHASVRRYQRLVLRPSPSSAPFYQRHGFVPAGEGMLMFVPDRARSEVAPEETG